MIRVAAAHIWGPAVAQETGGEMPDCKRCRKPGNEQLRVLWGCDRETPDAVFQITCPACDGTGGECQRCLGEGYASFRRCPNAILRNYPDTELRDLNTFLECWEAYGSHGTLPLGGGLMDQSASFLAATAVLNSEKAEWRSIVDDHHKALRNREKS